MSQSNSIKVTVAGNIILHDLPPPPLERLRLRLRVPNEKYVRAVRMGRYTAEPEYIEALTEMPDGTVHVPRGSIDLVKLQLARCDLVPTFEDQRADGQVVHWGLPAVDLRTYQREGIEKIVRHLQGLIVLPCGCGKTMLGVGTIAAVKRATLIIVHTQDLADQWLEVIKMRLGYDAGLIGGGRWEPDRQIVIGVDDSLLPYLEANPGWAYKFGLCIVDEAHHTPCKTFLRVLALVPAKYRLGLTATPDREDGQTPIMQWSFGPTLLERDTAVMIKLGYLMAAAIEFVETGWRFEWDGDVNDPKKIAEMEKSLSEDLLRNVGIADRVASEVREQQTVLVLANRREMVRELASMIEARGVRVKGVTSSTTKKRRREAIAAFKAREIDVLVATSLADEGLDVPHLSRVVLAFPQKARGATAQRLGRLLRLFDKKPKLIDYVDSMVPTLERRAQERKRVFRKASLIH